ncbi:beta-lactam-binding protein with PASTA domain [Dysgonomonas sp. PH5-45]|uniref:PASTA domain-containing protein n=1 Tax=unclassified Dysgonomonas TaxID=2630389 RepID=UPI002477073E|nr:MULTISPECIES: PASTA domain-containing protein [unclassified Dysgonomonas]MDH6355771.1 beta-lactam-binding protein with PASTA domain [Dysgonomonas sp. PH5-45]MDH6388668.1 beta-lactam-binding protein with PASTA domain [Dysgonomonas sp. PH5-37]
MAKSEGSFLKRIYKNIYIRSVFLMLAITFVLLFGVVKGVNLYTKHGSYVEVPQLEGLQETEAAAILKAAGLKYEVVDSVYEKKGTPGSVMDYVPSAGSKVKGGRVIFLTLHARGQQLITIPDVEDMSFRQAEALLKALGFANVTKSTIPSEYRDLVFSVSHSGRTLKANEKVPKNAALVLSVGSGSGAEDVYDDDSLPEVAPSAVVDESFME